MQFRVRWIMGLGGTALLAGIAVWLWMRQSAAVPMPAAPAIRITSATGLLPDPAASGAAVPSVVAADQDPADKAWCALAPSEPQANEEGVVGIDEINAARAASPSARQFDAASRRLRQEWARWLGAGDERSRALGLYLQDEDDPSARERLAALARQTRDPAVYALAYLGCTRNAGGCQGIDARRWTTLDPDNLQAWLREAGEAEQRGDTQAVQEAVWQMGRARRNESYVMLLMARLQQLPRSPHKGLRQTVETMEPYRWVFRDAILQLRPLTEYCKRVSGDTNRAQACADAANAAWATGPDLISRTLALALSRHGPRPSGVWEQRALEKAVHTKALAALYERQLESAMASVKPGDAAGCAMNASMTRYWNRLVDLGEWGVAELEVRRLSAAERRALEHDVVVP